MTDGSETALIPVHATIWAIEAPRSRTALWDLVARQWPGADRFDVRAIYRLDEGAPCPLDLRSPAALASNTGPGWAWVLHDPAKPPPLLEVAYDHEDGCDCLKGDGSEWGQQ